MRTCSCMYILCTICQFFIVHHGHWTTLCAMANRQQELVSKDEWHVMVRPPRQPSVIMVSGLHQHHHLQIYADFRQWKYQRQHWQCYVPIRKQSAKKIAHRVMPIVVSLPMVVMTIKRCDRYHQTRSLELDQCTIKMPMIMMKMTIWLGVGWFPCCGATPSMFLCHLSQI